MSDFALRNFSVWKCFKIKCFDLKSRSLPFSVYRDSYECNTPNYFSVLVRLSEKVAGFF